MANERGSERASKQLGLTPQGTISILAVCSVVVLVSLPLLRRLALMENQRDAVSVLRLLGSAVEAAPPRALGGLGGLSELELGELGELGELELDEDAFEDRGLEPVAGGRFLRGRGYYFDLVRSEAGTTLRAWPCEYGRTGFRSFVRTDSGALLDHDNGEAAFSGSRPPRGPWSDEAGWRELPTDADY